MFKVIEAGESMVYPNNRLFSAYYVLGTPSAGYIVKNTSLASEATS